MVTYEQNPYSYSSEYVYVEYPKWVTLADGTKILVNDAAEEEAAVGPEPKKRGRPAKS